MVFVSAPSQNLVIGNGILRLFRTKQLFAGWVMGAKGHGCRGLWVAWAVPVVFTEETVTQRGSTSKPDKQRNQVCVLLITQKLEFSRGKG